LNSHINTILNTKPESTKEAHRPEAIVISTRIRLARNLKEHSFPTWAKEAERANIWEQCQEALKDLTQLKKASFLGLNKLTELERQVLVERHLMSRELIKAKEGAGIVITKNQACSVMVNEEDHLRIQIVRNGFNFNRVWKLINELDDAIEDTLEYAFSPDLGYLTACPTNLGTAMRASVMMHLPGLVLADQMEAVVRGSNQLGLAVRGIFGEGSDASGSIFQISNQQSIGASEVQILKRLKEILSTIIEQEKNARQKLIETQKARLLDKIGRAYGILQNTHYLASSEAMDLLSIMRLTVDMGILPQEKRAIIDHLMLEMQPGHLQVRAKATVSPQERDMLRGKLLREVFQEMPPLNFAIIN
jgi:protein arginine kinase